MSAKPYLPCREIITFLADYIDNELPHDTRHEFERHLGVCASCTAYLASYRDTIRICRDTAHFDDAVVEAAPAQLIEAILRTRRS